ncbi:MAG TPA: ankyrin repeat domain-containing protein [Candidatus Babeliales bacterium]|jgi:ankyrin repeat protein|nr:ankyrin repeat domain-containing protein [Candidatus Babeliales bacterium]
MKHIFLITIFLLTTHSSQPMNNSQKNNKPSRATQLCLAGIEDNNAEQVRQALLAGADVNHTNSNGESLFYLATKGSNGNKIIIELITHEKIDLNVQNKYECTPLHVACQLGLSETVASIIKRNSQAINARSGYGCTPLHIASTHEQKDCIDLLLDHSISNINWQTYEGHTALHLVCARKNFNCIKLLLKKNADTTIKNNNHLTPLVTLFSYTDDVEFGDFINTEPLTVSQLIYSTDNEYNNQLHLCTKLEFINYDKFEKYLLFLISRGVGINARNENGKRPVDLACDEYNSCYNFYSTHKFSTAKNILDNQEAVMHAFLRFTPSISCANFQTILERLPQDLKNYIGQIYYALNIDTIIAKKYKHNKNYYDDFIENKNTIKQNLLTHPKPNLLWR